MSAAASKSSEGTPLVASADPDEKTYSEKLQTAGSLVMLVAIAVVKTQLTAFLFKSSAYPTAYSLYSCIVTDVLLVPIFIIKPSQFAVPSMAMAPTLGLIILFTSVDLGGTNIALANISTALQQCIAATNPFWAIIIESMLYQRTQHVLVYGSVVTLVGGAILTSLGAVTKLSTYGVVAAVVAVVASASKYVFTHSAFKKFQGQLGALALLFWVDLLMIPIYVVWTLANGELQAMLPVLTDLATFWQMTGTAALGGVRAHTQYVVLIFVSATSMSSANIFTQILNIVISIPLQHTATTPALVGGIAVVVGASVFYTFLKTNKSFLAAFDEALGFVPKSVKSESDAKYVAA